MVNIVFFRPNTYDPDYKVTCPRLPNTGRIVFFWHKNTNMCGMSPLGIISTLFLLVWLENIFGMSECIMC